MEPPSLTWTASYAAAGRARRPAARTDRESIEMLLADGLDCAADQRLVVETVVVRGQERDDLPETPLLRRRFGGLGGALGAQMDVGERKMAVHESKRIAQLVGNLEQARMSQCTMRTFEVAVLDQRERGVRPTAGVIVGGNGYDKGRHRRLSTLLGNV